MEEVEEEDEEEEVAKQATSWESFWTTDVNPARNSPVWTEENVMNTSIFGRRRTHTQARAQGHTHTHK